MPFSTIPGVGTEAEWTQFFETWIKPAVEDAGLGYTCNRSTPEVGNLLAGIMRDLADADVVIADLTGKNANVFYELGVRHVLRGRAILLAQHHGDIPFDLRSYAYHIYDWKAPRGKRSFATTIARLLRRLHNKTTLPDNPVEDFMRSDPQRPFLLHPERFASQAQRDAAHAYWRQYSIILQQIDRGQIPIPGGHGGYFHRFLEIVEENTEPEEVCVFASLRPLEAPGALAKFNRAELFRRLTAAVGAKKVVLEYILFLTDEGVTQRPDVRALLDEYCTFAKNVMVAYANKVKVLQTDTERTIVLLRQHRCAFTHTWSSDADVVLPTQWITPDDYRRLSTIYAHTRMQADEWPRKRHRR